MPGCSAELLGDWKSSCEPVHWICCDCGLVHTTGSLKDGLSFWVSKVKRIQKGLKSAATRGQYLWLQTDVLSHRSLWSNSSQTWPLNIFLVSLRAQSLFICITLNKNINPILSFFVISNFRQKDYSGHARGFTVSFTTLSLQPAASMFYTVYGSQQKWLDLIW